MPLARFLKRTSLSSWRHRWQRGRSTWSRSVGQMIVQAEMETELLRVWTLISELSDQLQENRDVTADLRAQAEALKVLALFHRAGFIVSLFYRQKPYTRVQDIHSDGSTWIYQKVVSQPFGSFNAFISLNREIRGRTGETQCPVYPGKSGSCQ